MKCGTVISVEHRITVLSELYKNWVLSSHCERVRFKSFWESQIQVIVRESSSSRCEWVKFKSLRESQIRVIVRELSSSHCERVRFKSLWASQVQVIVRESSSSHCARESSSSHCKRVKFNFKPFLSMTFSRYGQWEFLVWKLKNPSSIIC